MKKYNILATFVLFALVTYGQKRADQLVYPQAKNFVVPKVETYTLKNGIKVYMLEDKELPLIDLTVVLRTGSCMEPADKVGLTGMLGSVMRQGGSIKYPAEKLDKLLENKAASIEGGIGLASGNMGINALKEDFTELLPVFIDYLMNPALPQDKIDLAKKQQRSGISRRNDDAQGIARREIGRLVYGASSVYGRNTEYYTVDKITREDLVAFHKQHFVGANMSIGIVGDFDAATMKKLLAQYFEPLPAGKLTQLNLPATKLNDKATVNLVDKSDVNQSVVFLGHLGGRRQNPDYPALQVMNEVLSGGFSGRLFQKVRTDLGLAYSVFGEYGSNALYDGRFFAGVMTKSSTTGQAIDAVAEQIKKIKVEPVTEKEMAEAKDRILNSVVFRYDSRSKVMFEKVNDAYNGLPANAFEQYIEGVKKVTIADVQRVAKQYLKPELLHLLVVGNVKELGSQLDKFGKVNTIDITIPTAEPGKAAAPVASIAGDAAKGKELISKMADAVIKPGVNLKTLQSTSNITQYNERFPGGKIDIESKAIYYYPDSFKLAQSVMGNSMELVLKGEQAVQRMMGQERPLPAQMANSLKADADRHYVFLALNKDKLKPLYQGLEKVGDKEYIKLAFEAPSKFTLYLDPATNLPARVVRKELNPAEGKEVETIETLADWREADGVKMAYSRKVTADGNPTLEATTASHSVNR